MYAPSPSPSIAPVQFLPSANEVAESTTPGRYHPPDRYTPLVVTPPGGYSPNQVHPRQVHPLRAGRPPGRYPAPPPDSQCGRYASYCNHWQCFLVFIFVQFSGSVCICICDGLLHCFCDGLVPYLRSRCDTLIHLHQPIQ